jgi:hypothetical protein
MLPVVVHRIAARNSVEGLHHPETGGGTLSVARPGGPAEWGLGGERVVVANLREVRGGQEQDCETPSWRLLRGD